MHADLVRRAREAADSLSGRQPEYVEHMCVSPGDPEGLDAADLLRELAQALESPVAQSVPVAVPEFHSVARRKLDSLLADGWSVNGYSIIKGEGRRGFVDFGGFVGWWLPEYYKGHSSDTTPQPASAGPVVTLEAHPDDLAVDRFAAAMKAKLRWEREERGRGGWDDPEQCSVEYLAKLLVEHLSKGNAGTFEDVANFAMMLNQRGADPAALSKALSSPTPVGVSARPNYSGWRSIDTAPEDCRVILSTTGNWVGEAIMLRDEDTGEQVWTWVDTGKPSRHSCLGWMPMPDALNAPVLSDLRPDGFDGPTGAE